MSRVTISLEYQLARQLDRLVKENGYANRSAAVREMIQFGLDRADLQAASTLREEADCVAHVSYLGEPTVGMRVARLLQTNKVMVRSSTRVHFDDERYMEIVVLVGLVRHVKTCAAEICGIKGVTSSYVRLNQLD